MQATFPFIERSLGLLTTSLAFLFAPYQQTALHTESSQELAARLNPEQKQKFEDAMTAFKAQRYADALAIYKPLLNDLKGDPIVAKLASEAALNTGDISFALTSLKGINAADPNDWLALALFTRACAESGDKGCRDSGMAKMIELHRSGVLPPGMQQYILEHIKVGENSLVMRTSVEPWGVYKVYELGQVLDKDGKMIFRITLESSDNDQKFFAGEHPEEAAKGIRRFTFDGYKDGLDANGQRVQTHFTFAVKDGEPDYDAVRDEFISIAGGKKKAMISRTYAVNK